MLSPITESELEFLSMYFHPTSLTENLVPENINAAHNWPNCPTIYLRPYQFTMQNYSYLYADDPKKSKEENFRIKKMVGDCYMIGARNLGKSFFTIIDCILSIIHGLAEIAIGSFDDRHLQKVTNPIGLFIERHKFLKIFHLKDTRKSSVNRGTSFEVMTEHGSLTKGVNEKVGEPNAGEQYHSLHSWTRFYEEFSYASAEGQLKGVDAVHKYGCIERPSGIPDLNIGSPLGKIIQDKKMKPWVWRFPQFARADWTEKTEQEKADLYGGRTTASFKLNVEAEITEGAFGYFDMVRLKENSLDKSSLVKFFEIGKESFGNFESSLIIERLPGAEQCFICADLGFGAAPTEIIILFYDGKKYKWVYNISLFRLSPEEQPEIFYWLYNKLGGAFISLDSTSDSGAMIERLAKKGIPRSHLLAVKFNENMEVGFEHDENNQVVCDSNGEPVTKKIGTEQFSFQELERLFYSGKMSIPPDEKFLSQFTNIICKQTKTRPLFDCKIENHLAQSFQCFSVGRFYNEWVGLKNCSQKKRGWLS